MNKIMDQIPNLSSKELKKLRSFITDELDTRKEQSYNSRISIQELNLEEGLESHILAENITNLEQFIQRGTSFLPSSLKEKGDWVTRVYDFSGVERNNKSK